jgi:hypothetical protein
MRAKPNEPLESANPAPLIAPKKKTAGRVWCSNVFIRDHRRPGVVAGPDRTESDHFPDPDWNESVGRHTETSLTTF